MYKIAQRSILQVTNDKFRVVFAPLCSLNELLSHLKIGGLGGLPMRYQLVDLDILGIDLISRLVLNVPYSERLAFLVYHLYLNVE